MKLLSSLMMSLILLPLIAVAQQPAQPIPTPPMPSQQTGPILVPEMDKDGDKKVSRKEFLQSAQERAEKQFMHLDLNGDGFITIEEENKARDQAFELMRKQLDSARSRAKQ